MEYKYYAKSNPVESVKEHTDKLLKNLSILKNVYGKQISEKSNIEEERFWELLEVICKYHDTGKVFSGFQNAIRKALKLDLIETKFDNEHIKHEQISPMFVPCKKYNMTEDERKLVYQAIFYHHERDNLLHIDRNLLNKIITEDIKPNLKEIENELEIEVAELKTFYLGMVEGQARIKEGDHLYKDYCLLKGLLHRLDHSSSAHMEIEKTDEEDIAEFTVNSIKKIGGNLNDIQKYCESNSNDNLILIGSTGIGKTEAALMWTNNNKAFFTLPIRVSINAIFDRIYENIEFKNVGLLHSEALDYLEDNYEFEETDWLYNQSKNLSMKLTVCTIDQIFPFVFKYKGYEKIYATFSYSKIIIDEIQAYSPEIVAILIKGIEMIYKIGGKFLVMTATLPRIYKDELKKLGIPFKENSFLKPIKRHKICMKDTNILNDLKFIGELGINKKILIIANTVNKSIEIYKALKEEDYNNVNLLHSRFIGKDRSQKEKEIKEFSNRKEEHGIWITTQIVEASIDIDFDYLFTEMSTLDSQFQRFGRCYRKREYKFDTPNVYIYTKDVSGVKYVYDEDIYVKSKDLLKQYDNMLLSEQNKVDMVDKLYAEENIKNSNFYKNFKNGLNVLNNIIDYEVSRSGAQALLRKIETISVIPKTIYEENIKLFEEYEISTDFKEKNKKLREIISLSTNIRIGQGKRFKDRIKNIPYINSKFNIYFIDLPYSKDLGLILNKDEEYDLNERFC